MSSSNRRPASSSKGAPAAALLGGGKPQTKIIEGTTVEPEETDAPSPAPEPQEGERVDVDKDDGEVTVPLEGQSRPMMSADSEEHAEIQRRYREHQAVIAREEAAARAESEGKAPEEVEAPAETPEQRAEREANEAELAYQAAVEAMPEDEVRYVAGPRAKGLRSHGRLLRPGDVIPGAARWPRIDTWVQQGQVVQQILTRAG